MQQQNNADELSRLVIGAAIEVHRQLGPGYLEVVYEEALALEMGFRDIPFQRQHTIHLAYKNQPIGEGRLDFLVGGCLIIELKAVEQILPIHQAQVISYLRMTDLTLGLILNFNVKLMTDGIKRIALNHKE